MSEGDYFDDLPVVSRGLKRTYSKRHNAMSLPSPPPSSSPPTSPGPVKRSMLSTSPCSGPRSMLSRDRPKMRPLAKSSHSSMNTLPRRTNATSTKRKDETGKKGLIQMHLNLLPAHVTCKECGMSYTRTLPADLALHTTFHQTHLLGLSISPTLATQEIIRLSCTKQTEKTILSRCCEIVDSELSASTTSLLPCFTAFLLLRANRIISFVLVQPVSQAFEVTDSGDLSDVPRRTVFGVNRMWTSRSFRGRGLVRKCLDFARIHYIQGCLLQKSDVAFTQLSHSGTQTVKKWVEDDRVLIYRD